MSTPLQQRPPSNVVRPFGYSASECGYCKGSRASLIDKEASNCSHCYGMLGEPLTPQVYEKFVYRGWRRSGTYLYKPSNFSSCCPALTIRLLADKFQNSKSQSKLRRKMDSLLQGPAPAKTKIQSQAVQAVQASGIISSLVASTQTALEQHLHQSIPLDKISFRIRQPSKQEQKQNKVTLLSSICAQLAGQMKLPRDELVQAIVRILSTMSHPDDPASVESMEPHVASGQIVVTVKVTLQSDKGSKDVDMADNTTVDKLAQWYETKTGKPLASKDRKMTIETLAAHKSALMPEVHQLYAQYQHVVHNDPNPLDPSTKPDQTEEDSPVAAIAAMDWGPNAPSYFTENVATMLQDYIAPHAPEIQKALLKNYFSFYQFLVENPFELPATPLQFPACGTYHQHYRIGETLIAVGMVDLLPNGLSSVYLIYDPAFSHSLVAMGKLAILKEIDCTQTTQKPYYYLGYYIESCQKMRYKAEYFPSQLLCPVSYQWVDCSVAVPKLQATPQHVCALVDNAKKAEPPSEDSIARIPMDIGAGMAVTLGMLQENGQTVVRPILSQLAEEAGPELSQECLVKLA